MCTVSGIVTLCKLPYRALFESGMYPKADDSVFCSLASLICTFYLYVGIGGC